MVLTRRSNSRLLPVIILLLLTEPTLTYFLDIKTVDSIQFLRTYVLYVFAVLMLGGFLGRRPSQLIRSQSVLRALQTCLIIVVALSVLQVASGLAGSLFFFNPFRSHQYLYQYDPGLAYAFPRAAAFYLEPAFNALVILSVGCSLILMRFHPTGNILLMVIGVASSGSASGLATLATVLFIFASSRRRGQRLFAMIAIGAVFMFSGSYVIHRLSSVESIGSSANYRIEAPLAVLQHVLSVSPFGFPLGSVDATIRTFGLLNGSAAGSTLDNGYYLLVFYFGLIGILMSIALVGYIIKLALRNRKSSVMYWPFGLAIMALPLFTGGIILPEFLLPFGVVLMASRVAGMEERQQQ